MTFLDYVVLVLVGVSVVLGTARGILKGTISVLSALVGLVAAAFWYEYAARFLVLFVSAGWMADLVAFAAIFLLVFIAGAFVSFKLRRRMKQTRLSWLDRVFGGVFGFLRGWLLCSVLYLALTAFPLKVGAVERATFAPLLLEGTKVISYITSRDLRDRFLDGYARIKKLNAE